MTHPVAVIVTLTDVPDDVTDDQVLAYLKWPLQRQVGNATVALAEQADLHRCTPVYRAVQP